MDLSNRELAALIWIVIGFGYIFFKDKNGNLLPLLKQFIQLFFVPKIIIVMVGAALWITLCVQLLHHLNAWENSNLKTTILWSFAFAFVTLMDVNRISEDSTYFKKTIRDTVNATAIITFIAEAYSFSLLAELLLFPFLFIVTAMHIMSENKKEHASVHKLMSTALVTAGCIYIGYGMYMASTKFEEFSTWNNVREFSTPIILSLLFLPYLYLISVLISYELIWVSLRFVMKDKSLRRYAMLQAFIHLRLDLQGLRRWKRNIGAYQPENREAIVESISEIKRYQKREKNPPNVSPDLGWCPIAATEFLLNDNLKTSDYHRIHNDEWWATASPIETNKESLFSSNIAYYLSGDEQAVKRLKLVLNVKNNEYGKVAEEHFLRVCKNLLLASIGNIPSNLLRGITHNKDINVIINGSRIQLCKEAYANTSREGYSRSLIIDHNPNYRAPYE